MDDGEATSMTVFVAVVILITVLGVVHIFVH
jgi:hypothetical protein